ncbi:hypothetical protein Tcan_08200 [Toxocara canis]|uniref:Ground-like domain-containing protein n=1 Tax=Toxocara canis TaxID=6265 RepID=A0A0B2VNL5_TOXCA|nr:hypothetical protein Tcan_08200 [Toxocara canis]
MLITLWALCCWICIHRVKAQYGYRAIYKNGYFVDVRPGREIASAPGGYGGTVVNRVDMKGFEDTERKGMHLLPFVDNKKIELPDTSRSRFTVGPPGIDTDIFLGQKKTKEGKSEGRRNDSRTTEPERAHTDADKIPEVVHPSLRNDHQRMQPETGKGVPPDYGRIPEFKSEFSSDQTQLPPSECFINQRECNTHILVRTLQRNAEQKFGITFEIIVSPGDFASKSHFKDNLICKDYISRKYVLIYATPASYVVGEENTQSEVNTLDE